MPPHHATQASPTTTAAPTGRLPAWVGLGVLALYLLHAASWWFVCDDAYISFRYARNLVEGAGLVYNPGEAPPVEGYTNLLWVLWSAPWQAAGLRPELPALLTSLAAGAWLCCAATRLAARRLRLSPAQALAGGALLASLPLAGVWATSGLETMACAACAFLCAERLLWNPERPALATALLAACATIALRADGFVAVAIALAFVLFLERRLLVPVLQCALVALAAWLACLLARHMLHDAWWPHTAKAKTGFDAWRFQRGGDYAASMLAAMPALAVLLLAPLWAPRAARRAAWAGALVLASLLGWSVLVGGDFMAYGRFLVPAVGFLALAAGALALRGAWLAWGLAALSLLPSLGVELAPASVRQALHFRWNETEARGELAMWRGMKARAMEWLALGEALGKRAGPGDSIVLGAIGATGYASRLRVHDQHGLVSPAVLQAPNARQRGSPGHDLRVEAEHFAPLKPTWYGAWFAREDEPAMARLPDSWKLLVAQGGAVVERRTLPTEEQPFERAELRMLKPIWR
jgi:arabinofuranosyltransferase